ncbi:hypothetical protein [Streptomyces sp. NPDC026673]|uniref:hypothetical protein n=1 Tax=Streptomyces sp. NPDC026673 TaxID=3155724 RepID=UPI0033F5AEE6
MNPSLWYVLVEEDSAAYESLGSEVGGHFRHWRPASVHHAEQGRQQARELASELTRSHLPSVHPFTYSAGRDGTPGRTVFRLGEDSWLVELHWGKWRAHFRVSLAEADHTAEEAEESWYQARLAPDDRGLVTGKFRRGR